jgi:hypothetical protein
MQDDTIRKAPLVVVSDNDELQLTANERRLLLNFRAVRTSAKEMLLDLSDQYARTLPAAPVGLRLLGPAKEA